MTAIGRKREKNWKRVRSWQTYLLTEIPEAERRRLSESAAAQNTSVADVIRGLLCARYNLHCPPMSTTYNADRDRQTVTMLLRLQPKLWRSLEAEVAESGWPKRKVILETIRAHYEKGEQQ